MADSYDEIYATIEKSEKFIEKQTIEACRGECFPEAKDQEIAKLQTRANGICKCRCRRLFSRCNLGKAVSFSVRKMPKLHGKSKMIAPEDQVIRHPFRYPSPQNKHIPRYPESAPNKAPTIPEFKSLLEAQRR